eukprot:SAG31_NODE_509_length_14732_cov_13.043600_7_plen_179_part_00
MGGTTSKYMAYEDAVTTLGPSNLLRIREAWQQLVTGRAVQRPGLPLRDDIESNMVPRAHFNRSVLGGRFPDALGERIFYAFTGKNNKESLCFTDFLCTMAALMHGDEATRAMFLFALFDLNESGYIEREHVLSVLLATERRVMLQDQIVQLVDKLFQTERGGTWSLESRATFKNFHSW